jgi:hypothetical protein
LNINNLNENFSISVPFNVATVEIDPDVATISKNNTATLGIGDAFAKAEFQLFPNPTSNTFQIITDTSVLTDLKIYDLHGRLILDYQDQLKAHPAMVFDAPQIGGIYFIKLTSEKAVVTKKLMVR